MEINGQEISKAEFEKIFKNLFASLHSYAFTIIRGNTQAEDIVQNIFFKLWEKKNELFITTSIKAYLYNAVHNESLNYLKHLKVKRVHQTHVLSVANENSQTNFGKMATKELEEKITEAIQDLPPQCSTIFQLSRFENLKYREIADQLGLSVKTVENQMGKALKLMRMQLIDYLPMLFLFSSFINLTVKVNG